MMQTCERTRRWLCGTLVKGMSYSAYRPPLRRSVNGQILLTDATAKASTLVWRTMVCIDQQKRRTKTKKEQTQWNDCVY